MKTYKITVRRIKTNEFEIKAKNKDEAIASVINIINKSSLLEHPILNQVQTELTLVAKKIKK